MRRLLFVTFILAIILALPNLSSAACTETWTGAAGDGLWQTAGNWSPAGVPGPTDDACIGVAFSVTLSAGAQSINSLTSDGTLTISGGSLDIATASTANTLNLSSTISGAGALIVSGVFNWTAGTMSGTGTTTIPATTTLNISGFGHNLTGRTLNIAGTATQSGVNSQVFLVSGATVNIQVGGVYDLQNDQGIFFGGGTASTVNNAGTFQKSAGTGTGNITHLGMLNNTGAIAALTGTLSLASGGTNSGSFTAATGATISFASNTFTLNAGTSFSGAGTVAIPSATLTLAVDITVNTANFTLSGGTINGSGNLTVATVMNWTAGTMSGTGTTTIPSGTSLNVSGFAHNLIGRTLNIAGTATQSGVNSQVFLISGATVNIHVGGMYDLQNDQGIFFGGGTASTVNNAGTFQKSAGTGTGNIAHVGPFTTSGTVLVLSGTLSFTNSGGYTQTAGATIVNGGILSANSTLNIQGGTIGGAGTVSANVNDSGGTVTPGVGAATGIFGITGTDSQGATSGVNIRIGGLTAGTQFDQFNTSGAITLNGALNLSAVGGFRPATGGSFTILNFASHAGTFAAINGTDLGSGCSFQTTVNATNVMLQAVSTGPVVVTINPTSANVSPGATQQFTSTVTGDCNLANTWSVEEGASGGSITSTGLYTAPALGGTFHVRSTSVADPTMFARATVTVLTPPTDVVIAPARATLPLSGIQKFRANTPVNWTVTEGPSGGTIDAQGNYTAPATAGVFHVKATSQSDVTRTATALATVSAVVPRFAYVANFEDGTVSTYWEVASTGQLRHLAYLSTGGINPVAQALTTTAPGGPFLYVVEQGSNNLSAFAITAANGTLTAVAGSPFATGTQPQSVAVTPPTAPGVFVLVANAGTSNSVSVFSIDATGAPTEVVGSPFAAGNNPQSIVVTPSGQFVLVANAADNTVSVFSIDATGTLTPVGLPVATGTQPQAIAFSPNGQVVFVANQGSNNVSVFTIDGTGTLTQVTGSPFAAGTSPLALGTDQTGKYLYVVNRGSNNVSAFNINAGTGALTAISGSPFAVGTQPRSLAVDAANVYLCVGSEGSRDVTALLIDPATGALSAASSTRAHGQAFSVALLGGSALANAAPKLAYAANSASNDVSAYTIATATGALTPVTGSPFATGATGPQAVTIDSLGRFVFTADNGSNDVAAFTVDPAGVLTAVAGSPFGAGMAPRALTAEISGRFLYVVNATSGDVYAFSVDPIAGALTAIGSPVTAGTSPSGVAADPSGRFLYVTSRGSNNVSAFTINSITGALTAVTGSPFGAGTAPVSVAADSSGRLLFVANHDSNSISVYTIDSTSGALAQVAGSPFASGTNPTAVAVTPSTQFVYVTNEAGNNVTAYTINASTFALTELSGSPFVTGTSPQSVAVDVSSQYLFVVNQVSNDVWVYAIDPTTGAITSAAGSPFPAGTNPFGIATTGTIQ